MENEFDFKKDLELNKNDLEGEAARQASIFGFWAEKLADADFEYSKMKDYLNLLIAQKDIKIRTGLLPNGIKKLTENIVSSLIEKDSEIIDTRKKLRELKNIVNHIKVAVDALQQKNSQIKVLKDLQCKEWWSNKADDPIMER